MEVNKFLAHKQYFIDIYQKIFARRFHHPMRCCLGVRPKHLNRKEKKMLNHKFFVAVWVAVLIGLVGSTTGFTADVEKININTASAEELTQLKGIGSSHAAAIIEFREKNGPFKNPQDLVQVPRIGRKTFEKNKDLIIVQKSGKKRTKK
jgi:competence ComEA-like helix-hairpin-helix protein